jgi:aminoglycoside phosphotransferase (APT) family kinase protein
MTGTVHRLSVEQANGARVQVVLKRYGTGSLRAWNTHLVWAEVEALNAAAAAGTGAGIPAPTLLAADAEGYETEGAPSLLLSRVPGSVWLRPTDMDSWLRQQAELLPRVHALALPAQRHERLRWPKRVPDTAVRRDLWVSAIEHATSGDSPRPEEVRLHGDYQHFNVLWSRGRLTGLVDWSSLAGSPDVDVGRCRLNLTLLFGADVAERFRRLYEAEAGRTVDPLQDLDMLLEYGDGWPGFIATQVAGRAPVDAAGMTARVEELLERTLVRC